jgi:hypothetical protein
MQMKGVEQIIIQYRSFAENVLRLSTIAAQKMIQLHEKSPSDNDPLLEMAAGFLDNQMQHMRAILILERERNIDVLLIVRSMLEGASQLRYVRIQDNKSEVASVWNRFDYFDLEKRGRYWYQEIDHKLSPYRLMKKLEENIIEMIPEAKNGKLRVAKFFGHVSSYHHWAKTKGMTNPQNETNLEFSFSLIYGVRCLRYTIETINEFFDLGLQAELSKAMQTN